MELGVSHVQSLSSLTPIVDNIFDKYTNIIKNLVPIRSLPDHDITIPTPGCQPKTFKTFILMVKPLFFAEKPLFSGKAGFFSVFRVPRSYKILYFQQCPILSYILSICLIFQGI